MKILTMMLCLISTAAIAQQHVYHLSIALDSVTYQGNFTWTPNTVDGMSGQSEPGPGVYSNVSISDPTGTLTSAYDVFQGADNNVNQHDIWFTNAANLVMSVSIPVPGMGGKSVPVTGVMVYTSASTNVSCSACKATLTEVVSTNETTIPMATQIVDSEYDIWTMVNGQAVENGVATPSSAVIMLLYAGGVVYQENYHHSWWKWVGGKWVVDTSAHAPYSCAAP
jgi:hypothetical protein